MLSSRMCNTVKKTSTKSLPNVQEHVSDMSHCHKNLVTFKSHDTLSFFLRFLNMTGPIFIIGGRWWGRGGMTVLQMAANFYPILRCQKGGEARERRQFLRPHVTTCTFCIHIFYLHCVILGPPPVTN
jgi:hypothetical protein